MGVTSTQPSVGQSRPGQTSSGLILPGRGAPLAPGADQDAYLKTVTDEIQDKGFVVAKFDALLDWARTGIAVAHDVRFGVLRGGDDPRLYAPLRSGPLRRDPASEPASK